MVVPTVKVVSPSAPGGFVIINAADRKPHHQIWNGDTPAPDKTKAIAALGGVPCPDGDSAKPAAADKPAASDPPAGNAARPSFNLTPGAKKNR